MASLQRLTGGAPLLEQLSAREPLAPSLENSQTLGPINHVKFGSNLWTAEESLIQNFLEMQRPELRALEHVGIAEKLKTFQVR